MRDSTLVCSPLIPTYECRLNDVWDEVLSPVSTFSQVEREQVMDRALFEMVIFCFWGFKAGGGGGGGVCSCLLAKQPSKLHR